MNISLIVRSNAVITMNWKAFGPGILMASAAIGASHLISSTQAGALYGWQLAIFIVLANLFKYPFFRFGVDYTYESGKSLVEGYAQKSRAYLYLFFVMAFISGIISTGAVAMLCAVILGELLPESWSLSIPMLSVISVLASWLFLVAGRYKLLDGATKWIVILLTITTILAVAIAMGKPSVVAPDFVPASPFNLAALGFIVALMGWMPAPIEISAITSLWTIQKRRENPKLTHEQGLLDFNVGFLASAILAIVFLALGALVQYGSGQEIQLVGGKYVGQLIGMYTQTIGEWSGLLVASIAFLCMFGSTITVIDGYARLNAESVRLIRKKHHFGKHTLRAWLSFFSVAGLVLILYFGSALTSMLKFAMIMAFVSAPVFAWLNFALAREQEHLHRWLRVLSWAGLVFLTGFALLFLSHFFGILS
ncbi:NRAMP family divalent metal transporter [Moraxella sp. ZY200743]|uniref:NRAMP family divalent metal transporter n=1 Tax=Moraxella sp. ZY200743 TaxID=2911970 RepID=UPI003D7CF25E